MGEHIVIQSADDWSRVVLGRQDGSSFGDSQDSFVFFYRKVDPRKVNFRLSATFEVDDVSGVEPLAGYGVMAVDTVASPLPDSRHQDVVGSQDHIVPQDRAAIEHVEVAHLHLEMLGAERLDVARVVGREAARHLHQLAMQVDDIRAAGPLVQVVNILRHNRHGMLLFQLCHKLVPLARLHVEQLLPPRVVELRHEPGIACPALGRRNILHIILFPKTSIIAECTDAAFGTHSRSSQDNDSHNWPFLC